MSEKKNKIQTTVSSPVPKNVPLKEQTKYKTIDLCAGIGGIRKGFELTGRFENVLSAEVDDTACKVYQHLFGDNPKNDLTSNDFKELAEQTFYDVLLAGFPCQTFSSMGLKKGFDDPEKGIIFSHIAQIIKETKPKAVFLENVKNLVSHDHCKTFKTILDTLENLNYKVIGVKDDGTYNAGDFVRNTRNFGLPQNRPRVYIIAINKNYINPEIKFPAVSPCSNEKNIFSSVKDILEDNVDGKYFLSSSYLTTLENHKSRQKEMGNGFSYKILNTPDVRNPIANTILATGGSGKERNLIIDRKNGRKYVGKMYGMKKTPVNSKCVRTMTPTEWGRLQGFIGYAFLDKQKKEHFSFPQGIPDSQKYKLFGNSVSIPVIETMAAFMAEVLDSLKIGE